jgi:ankyrin repeat protein
MSILIHCNVLTLQLLIEAGAIVDVQNAEGQTVLHLACIHGMCF